MKRVGEFLNFWVAALAKKGFLIDKSAMVILMDCDKPWTREHLALQHQDPETHSLSLDLVWRLSEVFDL